ADDLSLAVAGRNAEVGFAGLTGAIDDAAHDRDAHGDVDDAVEGLLDVLGEGPDVDLGTPARRAADDVEAGFAQVQRLEDLDAGLDLLDWVGRQGHADRVANALGQQGPDAD